MDSEGGHPGRGPEREHPGRGRWRSHDGPGPVCGCHGRGAQIEGFAIPCLLLLLSEKPSHGYELVERLESDFGMSGVDPGGVYRNLKRLEDDGCLDSEWETGDTGPARKTYRVTPEGRELLDLWATTVSRNRRILDSFLTRYRNLAPARGRDVRDDG